MKQCFLVLIYTWTYLMHLNKQPFYHYALENAKQELLSNVVSEVLLTRRLGPWLFLRSHQ